MGNVVARDERSIRGSLDAFPYLVFEEWIASYKLFKVARCMHEEYGPVVVKVFLHSQADTKKVDRVIGEIRRIATLFREVCPLWLTPHVAPYDSIEVSDESVLLVRQHHLRSLYQRLYTRPHLGIAEKRWIAWQMLAGLCELHAVHLCHGDIKTDNVFVTSLGQVILTDLSYPFKPTYVPMDDPAEVSFFFESGDHMSRHRCYLAPERFYSSNKDKMRAPEGLPVISKASFAMDVFSMGCTITEMMLDGQGIIDLPGLLLYRSGNAEMMEKSFDKIAYPEIVDLLKAMTALDPTARPTAIEVLQRWNTMCPPTFTSVLYPLNLVLLHPLYRLPDFRIWLLRVNFPRLLQVLGLPAYRVRDLDIISQYDVIAAAKATLPRMSKNILASNSDWTPPLLEFSSRFAEGFMNFWAKRAALAATAEPAKPAEMSALVDDLFTSKENWEPTHKEADREGAEGTLDILVTLLCTALPQSACPRLRIIAVEMLEVLSAHAPRVLEAYIVPFLYQALSDRNTNVVMAAVKAVTHALMHLPVTNACVQLFLDHIAPQLMRLCDTLPGAVAAQLPALLRFAHKLADFQTIRSAMERLVKQLMSTAQGEVAESQHATTSTAGHHVPGGGAPKALPMETLRGVKSLVLSALEQFVTLLGREGVHNFLLPYLISFMNDPLWEIRAHFCTEMHKIIPTIGRVSTEGIVWPCYEQALLDNEARVVVAALHGIQHIVSKRTVECVPFKRQFRFGTVVGSICPLLLHPSLHIRDAVLRVLDALEPDPVEFHAFLLPKLKPYVRHCKAFDRVSNALWRQPLSKQTYDLLFLKQSSVPPASGALSSAKVERKNVSAERATTGIAADPASPANTAHSHAVAQLRTMPIMEQAGLNASAERVTTQKATTISGRAAHVQHTVAPLSVPIMEQARMAILQSLPLPEVTTDYAEDFVALDLMRTYLTGVLRAPRKHPVETKQPEQLPTQRIAFVGLNAKRAAIHPLPVAAARTWPKLRVPNGKTDWRVHALRLPYFPRQLGTLTRLDGTPFSLYSEDTQVEMQSRFPPPESRSADVFRDRPIGLAGIAASAMPDDWSDLGPRWQPSQLACTLHEYQVDGHITPVVKVDCTDDSRILVTGGKNGVVKLWNSTMIDKDVALASGETFKVGDQLRTLRTIRNAKAVAVASADHLSIMRIEASNHGSDASPVVDLAVNGVMCMDQFDTHLESILMFARSDGVIAAWDIRSRNTTWNVNAIPPELGVPQCMTMSKNGFTSVFGTWGGGLCVVDLRFQRCAKRWKVANSVPIMALSSAKPGTVIAALGSDTNQVAQFNVETGATVALFEATQNGSAPVEVPSLVEATSDTFQTSPDGVATRVHAALRNSARCLWTPKNHEFFLASGSDRLVRYWNLDFTQIADSYTLSSEVRSTVTSNYLGDVFVARCEANQSNLDAMSPGPVQPSTLHWDAVLDMCVLSLNHQILVTAGRDGFVKLWK